MKQAFHIFQKDVRRLWVQIALLMAAIGYFAWQDIRISPLAHLNSSGNIVIEGIVGAMVWFLIARAVHDESLPGDNQFWLTRPYRRGSLLGAKLLMVAAVVLVPFFVADCAILSAQSLPVAGNLGGLIVRQVVTAIWLVLPPFAIASVTRSITEDVMVWIVGLAIAGLCYFPGQNSVTFAANSEKYWLAGGILLTIGVLWQQYLRRNATVGRTLMAAAVLLPALPFPNSAAAGIEQMRNDPAASAISISAKSASRLDFTGPFSRTECVSVRIGVNGIRPGWRVTVLAEKDTFTADGGKMIDLGWHPGGTAWNMETLPLCGPATRLGDLGAGKLAVHTSVILGVFANEAPVSVKATSEPFTVPGVGRCQFRMYGIYYGQNYLLMCDAAVWGPTQGSVTIAGDSPAAPIFANEYPVMPMGLLPGMSPVYKWTTLARDVQIRHAIENGESVVFQPEKRIAVVEREIDVADVGRL